MKILYGLLLLLGTGFPGFAQYYYNDILGTRQSIDKWKSYQAAKVRSVAVSSFEGDGRPTDGFEGRQVIDRDSMKITTFTKTNLSQPEALVSYYNAQGQLVKTVDTSDTYQSTTIYTYDASGNILTISNSSLETDNQVKDSEVHIWHYDASGLPINMLKVKSGTDSTYIEFVKDENGNIVEEKPMHLGERLPSVYYYYQDHHLTDIVRYNQKAGRLLPDYMFTYNPAGHYNSMIFVPPSSTNYQKWIYQYNDHGLKATDACYNKRDELLGRIEYQYNYYR
jgi:YD repeat-containing protein